MEPTWRKVHTFLTVINYTVSWSICTVDKIKENLLLWIKLNKLFYLLKTPYVSAHAETKIMSHLPNPKRTCSLVSQPKTCPLLIVLARYCYRQGGTPNSRTYCLVCFCSGVLLRLRLMQQNSWSYVAKSWTKTRWTKGSGIWCSTQCLCN